MLIPRVATSLLIKLTKESTFSGGGTEIDIALIGNSPGDFTGMLLDWAKIRVQKSTARLLSVSFFLML